jgi:hypothetical protein
VHTVYDYSLFCPNAWNVWPDGTVCAGGPGRKCFAHGCESNHKYDARVVLAARLRLRLLRRVADAVIAPSEHLAGLCAAHGFARVTQLPYYPPEPAGAPAAENGEPVRVLCVSRLEKEKGVAVLVEALPRLRSLVPGAALALVGAGPEEESLRARVQALGLGDAVEFAGAAPRAALAGHLARAGVLALPSIWCEALPLIAFDAMAAGVPMVGTAIGGIPTVVRDGVTGLLCRPRDPADLAEKLARVLTDPALRDRLRRGAREDLARYDKARHLDALDGVYREARARPRRRLRGAVGGEVRAVLHRLLLRVDELERDNARIQAASVRLDAHRQELEGNVSDLNRRLGDLWHERDRLKGLLHRMASGKLTRLLNRLRGIEGLEEFHIKGK